MTDPAVDHERFEHVLLTRALQLTLDTVRLAHEWTTRQFAARHGLTTPKRIQGPDDFRITRFFRHCSALRVEPSLVVSHAQSLVQQAVGRPSTWEPLPVDLGEDNRPTNKGRCAWAMDNPVSALRIVAGFACGMDIGDVADLLSVPEKTVRHVLHLPGGWQEGHQR
jgi:hypothetical protein